jgi:hypothetical protein
MCCFSPVAARASWFSRLFGGRAAPSVEVADTSIFARLDGDEECLVYSMQVSVAGDVAMILPLPVLPGSGEAAVSFVDLHEHAGFFKDLSSLFVVPPPAALRAQAPRHTSFQAPTLKVHQVGSFEASFVPTQRDFSRLDARFRLPESVWNSLGDYDDWGFAVFRLKPAKHAHIHPMALRFRTRERARLFFPTVHVHDGRVHDEASFDHTLYYQSGATGAADQRSILMPARDYAGLVAPGAPVFRRELRGKLPNRDTWIG